MHAGNFTTLMNGVEVEWNRRAKRYLIPFEQSRHHNSLLSPPI